MMIIPFIAQIPEDEQLWLVALNRVLPECRVLGVSELSAEHYQSCTFAIVANPDMNIVKQFKNLVWVQSVWAGVEGLVKGFQGSSVSVVRMIDPNMSATMAEAVLAWCFYLQRDMPAYAKQQQLQHWHQQTYRPAQTLPVGILGLGELGCSAACRLKSNGFPVMGWSRSAKQLDGIKTYSGSAGLKEMLSETKILVCLLPLTPQTQGFIDDQLLSSLQKGAAIINFARGHIVDTDALLIGLDSGHVAHAVLDVFVQEPLPEHNPLWSHPKVTILPHISAPTDPYSAAKIVANNVHQYLETGKLVDIIDFNRGY